MKKTPNPLILAQFAVVLAIALALKLFYANASVNDLRWILAPTACLVELVTGETFRFESYAGYMSGDHSFLIAAPCAGVNFLITAFLMLALVRLSSSCRSRCPALRKPPITRSTKSPRPSRRPTPRA